MSRLPTPIADIDGDDERVVVAFDLQMDDEPIVAGAVTRDHGKRAAELAHEQLGIAARGGVRDPRIDGRLRDDEAAAEPPRRRLDDVELRPAASEEDRRDEEREGEADERATIHGEHDLRPERYPTRYCLEKAGTTRSRDGNADGTSMN